ncbi:sensor histidine kinase [Rugamonas sp. CCM 8940]|uniref:sensor histidine kinase n=1 Tax=Rugamonas sp. CCM 8940 TaxID=2765359 RepID=UPI0018F7A7A9|nr:HAMP domain-containing sensor histidine kinase [Rugamonas sp. CCM 8940]MBJ7310358.1 HAMP domain-containing histidine kinase [Rugamonas sp. CCM 8940]
MRLFTFIEKHLKEILTEWDSFAQSLVLAGDDMTALALRDHAEGILLEIAADIKTTQSARQQVQKSQGDAPGENRHGSSAHIHGALRQASNFSLLQLSAEFRALRATVLRLWLPSLAQVGEDVINDMVRFNEAIDQALAVSIGTFSTEMNETRELFLAILGHDLRAPLSTISMTGQILTRMADAGERVVESGKRIDRSARLMARMVEDLIEYSRTQLGKSIPVTLAPSDVGEACRAAIEDAQATCPATRFEFSAEAGLDGDFDRVRLHQLFANLFINAAQYGVEDRPVIIRAHGDADFVTVQVTNFGPPIPKASLESMFRPLVQLPATLEDARPSTSLGLGLYIARAIVVAHGGEIGVDSSEVDGTVFTVKLPRANSLQG